jgi:hypothetical protein
MEQMVSVMRGLLGAGLIALGVTGLVPALGSALLNFDIMASQPSVKVTATSFPSTLHPSAAMLAKARAVSWISSGHIVAP